MKGEEQFDFGENWIGFAANALTDARVEAARKDFAKLLDGVPLRGRAFLDIGFGQGLTVLLAQEAGAVVTGADINPKCVKAYEHTKRKLAPGSADPRLVLGSVLDDVFVESELRAHGGYDVVHSWGVLHHTGDMARAIANSASLVKPGGHYVIAIYNRHWSSKPWWLIKRIYMMLPRFLQPLCCWFFAPIIWLAKFLVTGKNPLLQERGMDFYYNVVDWVGGYPYEYASIPEMEGMVRQHGFETVKAIPAVVPTGCNEFVFRKIT